MRTILLFQGRIGITAYWIAMLTMGIVWPASCILAFSASHGTGWTVRAWEIGFPVETTVVFYLATACIAARLRDAGASRWWLGSALLLATAGSVTYESLDPSGGASLSSYLVAGYFVALGGVGGAAGLLPRTDLPMQGQRWHWFYWLPLVVFTVAIVFIFGFVN